MATSVNQPCCMEVVKDRAQQMFNKSYFKIVLKLIYSVCLTHLRNISVSTSQCVLYSGLATPVGRSLSSSHCNSNNRDA